MKKHVSSHSIPTSGFPCPHPQCGASIVLTIPLLLGTDAFYCGACGLKLELDRAKSEESLKDLRIVQDSHDNVINDGQLDGNL